MEEEWGSTGRGLLHHQTEQSSAQMKTAEQENRLRWLAPEPRAPMPATKTNKKACEEAEIFLPSKIKN